MAMQKSTKGGVKKTFFSVKVPHTSTKVSLYGASVEELNGKVVRLDMTRSLRGKNLEMKIRVKADGDTLVGEPMGVELVGSFIRRMMRRGADYVEDSFETDCKDSKVRVKPFMITRKKVSRSVRNSLRIGAMEFLQAHCKARTTAEVFTDIMTNKIQKELSIRLKKIYPLALCEIRVFEIIVPIKDMRQSAQAERAATASAAASAAPKAQ